LKTKLCIIGSGPGAHTCAIYAARAALEPILFEGWMANGIAAGGQLTTTTDVENFPGFPDGILGGEICDKFRAQSERFGTNIITETVDSIETGTTPFLIHTSTTTVEADTVVIATGAVARRLEFPGSNEFWQKGISACAVCDGAAPIFKKKPVVVVGGGDSAMEEATFLTKYASKVYVVHRREDLRASAIMQQRAIDNPKLEFILSSEVIEAEGTNNLESVTIKSTVTGETHKIDASGLFFAIGHDPATAFLDGQLELDEDGYVVTTPGTTTTSVPGIFAAGDVQDKVWRQAITAAGTGCMAALEAEHYLNSKQSKL